MKYSSYFQSLRETVSFLENNTILPIDSIVTLLLNSNSIYCLGIGKSSFIAGKMASLLRSICLNSHFIHPVDALHGDIGSFRENSVVLIYSKSGVGIEYETICLECKKRNVPIILITTSKDSQLSKLATITISVPILQEDPFFDTIPSVSSVSASIVSDLIVFGIIEASSLQKEEYLKNHPNGQIGFFLSSKVEDVFHSLSSIAIVNEGDSLKETIIQATKYPLGCVCVCSKSNKLVGIITDGDIRRYLVNNSDISNVIVESIMNKNPLVISKEASLKVAITLMESNDKKISVLPVVENGFLLGVIRLHDVMAFNF